MKKYFGFLIITLFLTAVPSFAWDDTGHKLTAYIAWQQMTPAAREKAIAILSAAPEDSMLLTLLPTDSRPLALRQQQMFFTSAFWADIVRDEKFPNRRKKYHHGTWHYTDIFFRQTANSFELVPDLKPDEENALAELAKLDKILRDNGASNAEKAVALAWMLHIVGDIHQPLHAVARVTNEEPKGDQGGNLFSLTPPDAPREKRENLHWYWDSIITRDTPRSGDEGDTSYIPRLAARIVKKYPAKNFANSIKPGSFSEWHQESFQMAAKELYPASLKRNEMPSESYRKRGVQIAEQRIAQAGYRIAEFLNRILGS